MNLGDLIGWLGIFFGLFVAPAQLLKLIRQPKATNVSTVTYIFLVLALVCYLIHAIYIRSPVFTVAQSVNLVTNILVLAILLRRNRGV